MLEKENRKQHYFLRFLGTQYYSFCVHDKSMRFVLKLSFRFNLLFILSYGLVPETNLS